MARHYCKFRSAHVYKTLVHSSVNNAQDVCVVFTINIFCAKGIEVQALRALIVNLKWCGDDSFTVPLCFVQYLLKIYHIRRFGVFVNCQVQVPTGGMDVCRECCVLSGRGLCDEPITRPEESYRLWRVVVCDQETSKTRRLKPATGLCEIQP